MEWSVLGDVADTQLLTRRNIIPEGRKREKVSFLGKMGEWGWGWEEPLTAECNEKRPT